MSWVFYRIKVSLAWPNVLGEYTLRYLHLRALKWHLGAQPCAWYIEGIQNMLCWNREKRGGGEYGQLFSIPWEAE